MSLKVTVLGSGTSHGVPMIGCDCVVCTSSDPRDRRTRPSILIDLGVSGDDRPSDAVSAATRFILVDTSTDLRTQALAQDVRRVDAILFTHSHADHVFGLDDVRRFNYIIKDTMPCFADARTVGDLRRTFAYIFSPPEEKGGGIPRIALTPIGGPFSLGGLEVVPIPVLHGARPILGFRIGSFAYLTDCNRIPDTSWPLLAGVRTLILDALRDRPHPTHFSLSESVEIAHRVGAERTYFTHICHELPHAATCARLPAGIELAYDGLVLSVPGDKR